MPHQELVGPPVSRGGPATPITPGTQKRGLLSRIGQGLVSFGSGIPQSRIETIRSQRDITANQEELGRQEIEANQQAVQQQQEIQQLSNIAFDPNNPDKDKALTRLFQVAPELAIEVQKGLRIETQAGLENAARRAASIQAQPTKELRDAEIRKQINDNPDLDLTETAQMLDMTFEQQEIPLRVTQAAAQSTQQRAAGAAGVETRALQERGVVVAERGIELREDELTAARGLSETARLTEQVEADLKTETGLRKEVNTLLKDFFQVADANARVLAAGTEPSAAGDLALIFNFMKMLDPGSTVREGEFATAQNSAGIPQRVVSLYNRIVDGQRLSGTQRDDFLDRASSLFDAALGEATKTADSFERIATNAGVNVNNVLATFQERAGVVPEGGDVTRFDAQGNRIE